MATSKRALYKPATQNSTAPKERRKPLAQGRLMTCPLTAVTAGDRDEHKNDNMILTHQDLGGKLSGTNKDKALLKKSESDHGPVENSATPRKAPPQVQLNNSPKLVKPTTSLDLSDTEDAKCQRRMPEVIFVDASNQIKSLDDSEVDIALHFAQSPAKVVCHTPSKVHSDLRNTGSVEQAARVTADKVPSICILDNETDNSMELRQKAVVHKVPTVIRESGIVGNTIDPTCLMRSSVEVDRHVSLSQQNKDMSHSRSQMVKPDQKIFTELYDIDSSDQGSEISENDPSIETENYEKKKSSPVKSKSTPAALNEEVSKPTGKKKAPRVIASRYLQGVNNPKGPLRATNRALMGNSSVLGSSLSSTAVRQKLPGSSFNKAHRSNVMSKKSAAHMSTPDIRSVEGTVNASTPKADLTTLFGNENVDVSAISALPMGHSSVPAFGLFHRTHCTDTSSDHSRTGGLSDLDSGHSFQGQKKKRGALNEVNQWTLELLYARHLQWAFLATKARKTLQIQEKQAMDQLYRLAELNNRQDEKIAESELELEKLCHINTLDDALDMQYSGLSNPTAKLSDLKGQHHHLAEALDTTRHHIPTKGIYIPDKDDQYLDDIARALQESEHLLGEISVMTRTETKDIDQCAKVLQAMEKVVGKETNELARCNSLLSAAVTLTTQENSLMVQQIQTRPDVL